MKKYLFISIISILFSSNVDFSVNVDRSEIIKGEYLKITFDINIDKGFFIFLKDAHWLDGNYTAFGKVIDNIQVIDFIADTPTDYIVAKAKCLQSLPSNVNSDNWIELVDPKTRMKLFSKVPKNKNKTEYKREMMKSLRSDNPSAPVIIKKIRVKDPA